MADPSYIDADGVLTDGEAWVGIAHASLSLPAALVTWTSTDDGQTGDFSQYMDLVLVWYCRGTAAVTSGNPLIVFNNDTSSSYSYQRLYGDGSSAVASTGTYTGFAVLGYMHGASATANEFAAGITTLHDVNSGKYKSILSQFAEDEDGSGKVGMYASTWPSQAGITEIDVKPDAGNFAAGSVFDLFGVLPRMVA